VSSAPPRTLADLRRVAEEFWPASTAEGWDRVGLVSGAGDAPLRRVLLAVDAVAATVDEALELGADALLARLIRGGCALLAAHTNADQPEGGVSAVVAERLGLVSAEAIVPAEGPRPGEVFGIGRVGDLSEATSLREFAERVAAILPETVSGVRVAGDPDRPVRRIALLGGAGDSLLDHPAVRAADVYLTSDLRHHPAQESIEQSLAAGGPALVDVAHWASESLWLEGAAERLSARLPGVEFAVSGLRTDPWSFAVGASRL
jgi:putative NIF3 family GTP cyclohydrolase 1 type 2